MVFFLNLSFFRARPVIDIVTWFGNRTVRINPSLAGCDMDPTSPEICFQLGMGDMTYPLLKR